MNPDRCNQNVFDNGVSIAILGEEKATLNQWCQEASKRHGQPIDWHYCGGRANVLALGDPNRAAEILREVMQGKPPEGVVDIKDERKT